MRMVRHVAGFAAATFLLAGCFTGERGYFATATTVAAGAPDAAVDAVLSRLDTVNPDPFAAGYTILQRYGVTNSAATVAQASPAIYSVTIGDVRFLEQDGSQQTCQLSTSTCTPGFNDALISNLVPSHDFYRSSAAARLRQDLTTKSGPGEASTRQIAGQTATCVTLPFAEGAKEYCALDNGLLAYQDTPDLQIELVTFTTQPALQLLSPTTAG